jgi:glycosyltransferase involved in cell wall biosynthesis
LLSLVAQETDGRFGYEIVVVDNGSKDHTKRTVEEIAARASVPIRLVAEPRRGQVYARNRGIAEARGEWIASFDDDQLADPGWLTELVVLAHDTRSRSVGGAMRLKLPADCQRRLAAFCRRVLGESVAWHTRRPYTPKQGPGSGNHMLHRSVFDEVGIYDESYNLRGYDTDLYRRLCAAGIESWYSPAAVAYHVTPPCRLTDQYLRDTSLCNGWCFARRDRERFGALISPLVLVARIGQMVGIHLPRLAVAKLQGDAEEALALRCRLWTAQGYTACAMHLMSPKLFAEPRFTESCSAGDTVPSQSPRMAIAGRFECPGADAGFKKAQAAASKKVTTA